MTSRSNRGPRRNSELQNGSPTQTGLPFPVDYWPATLPRCLRGRKTIMLLRASLLVTFSVCVLSGCTKTTSQSFDKVTLDPAAVAAAIMAEYDTDSDGEISKSELKKNSGLQMLAAGQEQMQAEFRLDQDGNGTVSEQEFANKLKACFADMRQSFSCRVIYRGRPLEGANVVLTPEPFMGTGVEGASGETNFDGQCSVTGDDGKIGAVPGIYKVEITHPDFTISPKYNSETTLSVALDTTNPYAQVGVPEFRVK